MYYLIKVTNRLSIMSTCDEPAYKDVLYNNFCIKNNIISVPNESYLKKNYSKPGKYSYKTSEDKYIVIYCERIIDSLLFSTYFRRSLLYDLEFVYYKRPDICEDCNKLIYVDLKK